jgi:hypothetical protein
MSNVTTVLRRYQKPQNEILFDSLWGAIQARVQAKLQVTPATPKNLADASLANAVKVAREKFEAAVEDVASAIPDLTPSLSVAASTEISNSPILSLRSHMSKIPRKSSIQSSVSGIAMAKILFTARPASLSHRTMFSGFKNMFERCVRLTRLCSKCGMHQP